MKIGIVLLLVAALTLTGCRTAGRWLAPIRQDELEPAAQQMMAKADREFQTQLGQKDVEIAKLKAGKSTPLWPIYLIGALSIPAGAVLAWLLGKILLGALLASGGLLTLGWLQFLERYPWAFWIPFALLCTTAAYWLYDWFRGLRSRKALDAIVPAIEAQGLSLSGLKSDIETRAGSGLSQVKAEVSAVKRKLGL